MKKTLFLFIAAAIAGAASAQVIYPAFNTNDSININNINARVLVHGDMFWDPQAGVAACEFPKGSGKHINFASALWMSGYDAGGVLHTAAQTYRQTGNDYWPGPLDTTGSINYANSEGWAKIWKVNLSDIQAFQALSAHTIMNTPAAILTWPGRGNTNATGNSGIPLAVTGDMAPFVDLNGNGIYEPLLGEYPAIKGDQALWWVFNDNGPEHTSSNGKPLKVEIHAMAYAYTRGTLIDNVVYFDFGIVNKSANTYNNYRLGLYDDIDIGFAFNDYVGFDSTRRLGVGYNANEDAVSGSPLNSYGKYDPIAGITMVVLPGDAGTNYEPAGSFIAYNNDYSIIGNPFTDTAFNDYLRGKMLNGISFYDITANSHHCRDHDSNRFYMFAGDPSDSSQCSECALGDTPGDRRFVISSNDFTLNVGGTEHVVMALITTNLDSNNICPTASFDSIRIVADTAWGNYYSIATAVHDINPAGLLNIYPNPTHDKLYIQCPISGPTPETIAIYNSLGQMMAADINKTGQRYEVDVSTFPSGLYEVLYRDGDRYVTGTFVKQ